ncbi:MAG: DUF6428 family protein [Flavobacteriaceae bacterium]
MTTDELLNLLEAHTDKHLLFEYRKNNYVGANYHITEIKNTTVDTVDCGSNTDFWKETVIQLWESPDEKDKTDYMSVDKALKILKKVHSIKPMEMSAEVKFEYGNSSFHTAHLYVADASVNNDKLIFSLAVNKTDCKARVGSEITDSKEACCPPSSGCC